MSSFHGVEVDALTVGGIRCRTSVFPPHFATAPHAHDEAYFCLVVDGDSAQRSGNGERIRERGRAYFYPSGETQSERAITDRMPRLRYPAGRRAGMLAMLRRFVPARAFDRSLRKEFRLDG